MPVIGPAQIVDAIFGSVVTASEKKIGHIIFYSTKYIAPSWAAIFTIFSIVSNPQTRINAIIVCLNLYLNRHFIYK